MTAEYLPPLSFFTPPPCPFSLYLSLSFCDPQKDLKGAALRNFLEEVKQWPNLKHSQDLKHFLTTDRYVAHSLRWGSVCIWETSAILSLWGLRERAGGGGRGF